MGSLIAAGPWENLGIFKVFIWSSFFFIFISSLSWCQICLLLLLVVCAIQGICCKSDPWMVLQGQLQSVLVLPFSHSIWSESSFMHYGVLLPSCFSCLEIIRFFRKDLISKRSTKKDLWCFVETRTISWSFKHRLPLWIGIIFPFYNICQFGQEGLFTALTLSVCGIRDGECRESTDEWKRERGVNF